jgi:hypothetical protein
VNSRIPRLRKKSLKTTESLHQEYQKQNVTLNFFVNYHFLVQLELDCSPDEPSADQHGEELQRGRGRSLSDGADVGRGPQAAGIRIHHGNGSGENYFSI